MSLVGGNVTTEEGAILNFRRPVHSESLLFNGTRYSLIIVQDDNPRLEWTREGERGTSYWQHRRSGYLRAGMQA